MVNTVEDALRLLSSVEALRTGYDANHVHSVEKNEKARGREQFIIMEMVGIFS